MRNDFQITKPRRLRGGWILLALMGQLSQAQTTQGLIAGKVFDSGTKQPLAHATVEYFRREQGTVVEAGSGRTNEQGFYTFAFLPPGTYQVRVHAIGNVPPAGDYQPQEIQQIELFVASRLEVNFALRKLTDVWRAGIKGGLYQNSTTAIIHFYAADVAQLRSAYLQLVPYRTSSLDATVSYVIDPKSVENLPLSGRDIYATLVLQPGVTADSATTRGLGLSANGQRTTSSNFLLDGVENNNYFLTGSLTPISPEAMQEYRVSVSSFSAEYGRTAGFLANGVTRAGGNGYHGLLFGYAGNELLNANSFQANAHGEPRVPDHELHAGYQVGGPILRNRLFFSSEFEQFRSRSLDSPQNVCLPVLANFPAQDKSHLSARLLTQFPIVAAAAPTGIPCNGTTIGGTYRWSPRVSIDRSLGLERLDYVSPGGADRIMLRLILSRSSRPDFIASPYEGLDSRLSEDSTGIAIGYTHNLGPRTTNQLRLGWTNYDLHWNRPHSEIPQLEAVDLNVKLPGSDLPYAFADRENHWELSDSVSLVRGPHVITAGGGILLRRQRSVFPFQSDGLYYFGWDPSLVKCDRNSIQAFANDSPCIYSAAVQFNYDSLHNTASPYPAMQPDPTRSYANRQFDFFVQDTWRATAHLSLSAGLRYESLGTLKETGAQDLYVQAGPGSSPYAQLQSARTMFDPTSQRSLYHPDRLNWAPRLGISYALGRTLLRAGYGVYYDRLSDTLTGSSRLNNVTSFETGLLPAFQILPPLQVLAPYIPQPTVGPRVPAWIDANLRSPRIRSWFASVEQPLSANLTLEIMQLGSSGRGLLTSDQVNRFGGILPGSPNYPVTYVGNQGASFYEAMATVLRYRARSAQFQVSYTWSHSIDNQSDPLRGGVDLGSATISGSGSSSNTVQFNCQGPCDPANFAFFSRQFDWRADRGNSDFDLRHNLIFYSIWELPRPRSQGWIGKVLSGWQVSDLAGLRSGFPINVYLSTGLRGGASTFFLTNRPDLTGLPIVYPTPPAVKGGVTLLNSAAFAFKVPPHGSVGGLGRNSIAGPGFWNVDFSIAKSFSLFGKESRRLQLRGDFFNVFNHANLGAPGGFMNALLSDRGFPTMLFYNPRPDPAFGQALYGASRQTTGFTAFSPLAAQQRQIQLQIKLFF